MTMRFIPRQKLGKKARKLLDREGRREWGLSPVTRRVESKKKYSRKKKSHADETAWDFCRLGADYFTAPVMPSANCFCSTKKMMIVGSEQNRTPSISMP